MNKYCLLLYLFLCIILYSFDKYTSILLLILIIPYFKCASKEYFVDSLTPSIPVITNTLMTNTSMTNEPLPTVLRDGLIVLDRPRPTENKNDLTGYVDNINKPEEKELLDRQIYGVDDRFKEDDVAVKNILREIKAQVDFDPYKTNLDKSVIFEIYNKYFDNDIFVKLKKNYDDSQEYIASGNFNYIPKADKVDYDLITYQNLSDNTQIGIDPLTDGIQNRSKINRG